MLVSWAVIKKYWTIVTLLCLILILISAYHLSNLNDSATAITLQSSAPTSIQSKSQRQAASRVANSTADTDFLLQLIDMLEQFREEIGALHIQASMYEVRDYVISLYPAKGLSIFVTAINHTFPAHAEAILAAIAKMDEYNHWLMSQGRNLAQMSELDNDRAIWKKRIELFGDAALKIWTGQLTAYEQRKQAMRNHLAELESSTIITNEEKLHQLYTSLENVFSSVVEGREVNKNLVAGLYWGIESVQQELQALGGEERISRLAAIRRRIGYTEQQIASMAKRDQEREQRWDNGLSYMQAKKKLKQQYEGEALHQQVLELQEKHFGFEAPTIAKEEASGFYRYSRERVIGRN